MLQKSLGVCALVGCLLAGLFAASPAAAAVIAYLSAAKLGDGAPPANLGLTLDPSAIGTTGSFNVWIDTDTLVTGATLSLAAVGNSIKLTGSTVPEYDPRWASVTGGTAAGDGTAITGLSGFAIPGVDGTGLDPAAAGSDPGYDAATGAFHFATVNYEVVGTGSTELWLIPEEDGVFHNESCTQFGVGDACLAKDAVYPPPTASDVPGYPLNPVRDGLISVVIVPEPASILLVCLALVGCASTRRR